MGPLDALWHLLNLFLPGARRRGAGRRRWPSCCGGASCAACRWLRLARWAVRRRRAGAAGRAGGLRPRRPMATYGAMVLACALALWWARLRAAAALSSRPRPPPAARRRSAQPAASAAQRMRQRLGDRHVDHLADQRAACGPPSKLTMRLHSVRPISSARRWPCATGLRPGCAAPCPRALALMRRTLASMRACSCCSRCSLQRLRRVVVQRRGRRAGARAEDEAEAGVEADVVDQLHRLREVVLGLAGEADDEVAGQADVRAAPRAACGSCSCTPARCSRASSPSGCGRCRAAPAGAGGSPAAARGRRRRSAAA